MAQTSITFRVDDSLKKDFDQLCDEFGLTNTAALTVFMKTVVRERRIPFEIRTISESETRMRADAAQSGLQGLSSDEDFIDKDDIVFYEVALSKEDSFLVTGNIRHFPKKPFIVTPTEMVAIINEMQESGKRILSEPAAKYDRALIPPDSDDELIGRI